MKGKSRIDESFVLVYTISIGETNAEKNDKGGCNVRKIVKTVICCILLFVLSLPLSGCNVPLGYYTCGPIRTRLLNPLTIEEIEENVREIFYEENGDFDPELYGRWVSYWKKEGLTEDEYPTIEGFTVYYVKDIWTNKEDCFCVEFEPTGYFYGSRLTKFEYSRLNARDVCPFKYCNVEEGERYVNSLPGAGPFCGIETEGYVVGISSYDSGKEGQTTCGYYYAFNLKTKKFENNVYLGIYDKESHSWIKETQGEEI